MDVVKGDLAELRAAKCRQDVGATRNTARGVSGRLDPEAGKLATAGDQLEAPRSQNKPVPSPPSRRRSRWTSFVADEPAPGKVARGLHEASNPRHRLRVEHDDRTLLIHLAHEDGDGWTTIAVDRATRRLATASGTTQADTARRAHEDLYRA